MFFDTVYGSYIDKNETITDIKFVIKREKCEDSDEVLPKMYDTEAEAQEAIKEMNSDEILYIYKVTNVRYDVKFEMLRKEIRPKPVRHVIKDKVIIIYVNMKRGTKAEIEREIATISMQYAFQGYSLRIQAEGEDESAE